MAKAPLLLFYKFLCVAEFYHYYCCLTITGLVKLWLEEKILCLKNPKQNSSLTGVKLLLTEAGVLSVGFGQYTAQATNVSMMLLMGIRDVWA